MMESRPSINRIVGKVSEEKREEVAAHVRELFEKQDFDSLQQYEREKTEEELQIIDLVNERTNKFLEKYGIPPYIVPARNIRTLVNCTYEKVGGYVATRQLIFILKTFSKVEFAAILFHEMIHFKSYNALQINPAKDSNVDYEYRISDYRVGLATHSRDGNKLFLNNMNEAVTAELERRYIRELTQHPLFKEDLETSDALIREHAENDDHDVYYVETYETGDPDYPWRSEAAKLGYLEQRKILDALIKKILSKNEDTFTDYEEVFDIFVRAMFRGNLVPLARLIDTTFGEGVFRTIAELDEDIEKQKEFVDSL